MQVPNDTLIDILTVVKEMRDHMLRKVDQEKSEWQFHLPSTHVYIPSDAKEAQELRDAPHQCDVSPEVRDAPNQQPFIIDTASPDTANQSE